MKTRRAAYEATRTHLKETRKLLNAANHTQQARIFRIVAQSPKPLTSIEVAEAIRRPKIDPWKISWYLSRMKSEGLLAIRGATANPGAEALASEAPPQELTISIPMGDLAQRITSHTGRWVTITEPRGEVFARIEKELGTEAAKRAMTAIGFFEITEPTRGNQLLGRINEGIRTSVKRIGFRP